MSNLLFTIMLVAACVGIVSTIEMIFFLRELKRGLIPVISAMAADALICLITGADPVYWFQAMGLAAGVTFLICMLPMALGINGEM